MSAAIDHAVCDESAWSTSPGLVRCMLSCSTKASGIKAVRTKINHEVSCVVTHVLGLQLHGEAA
jgi:hypothetical protein